MVNDQTNEAPEGIDEADKMFCYLNTNKSATKFGLLQMHKSNMQTFYVFQVRNNVSSVETIFGLKVTFSTLFCKEFVADPQ